MNVQKSNSTTSCLLVGHIDPRRFFAKKYTDFAEAEKGFNNYSSWLGKIDLGAKDISDVAVFLAKYTFSGDTPPNVEIFNGRTFHRDAALSDTEVARKMVKSGEFQRISKHRYLHNETDLEITYDRYRGLWKSPRCNYGQLYESVAWLHFTIKSTTEIPEMVSDLLGQWG